MKRMKSVQLYQELKCKKIPIRKKKEVYYVFYLNGLHFIFLCPCFWTNVKMEVHGTSILVDMNLLKISIKDYTCTIQFGTVVTICHGDESSNKRKEIPFWKVSYF